MGVRPLLPGRSSDALAAGENITWSTCNYLVSVETVPSVYMKEVTEKPSVLEFK